jgi:hypothetical protein
MKLPDFPAAHAASTGSKLSFATSSPLPYRSFFKFCNFGKFCIGTATLGLTLNAVAAEPDPGAASNKGGSLGGATTVAPTISPEGPTTGIPGKFEWSQKPAVSAPPRPGMFSIAPTGPGYYSLMDHISGNKRNAAPVFPYAPYALMTTPAFDMNFHYLEKPE